MGKSKSKTTAQPPAPAASTGLSSFLLGQAAGAAPLDDLFASSKGATTAFEPKKDLKRPSSAASPPKSKSKSKSASTSTNAAADEEEEEEDEVLSDLGSAASLGDLEDVESDEEEDEAGVEEAYAARLAAERIKTMQGKAAGATAKGGVKRKAEEELSEDDDEEGMSGEGEEEDSDDDDEDEEPLTDGAGLGDINDLILGSLSGGKKDVKGKTKAESKGKKSEKVLKRAEEKPEERDARTVFLGNVPAECSTSKSLKKALVRHVLQNPTLTTTLPSSCPPSLLKLDSIRFRSIAFASKVFGRKANSASSSSGNPNDIDIDATEPGGRGRKRAREWRESEGSDERGVKGGFKAKEERPSRDGKSGALTDAQKRRVAFIRGELNEGKKVCNAYLVLEALPEEVDVRAVVQAIVSATDNSVFNGVTLHADAVRPRSAAAILAAAQMAAKPNADLTNVPKNAPGQAHTVSAVEAKRTLFVGGLDFAETEENVRSATEAVLVRERGEPRVGERYVENVRIVRDASSGLGKGFCYVLLQDEQCVDELLALPPGKNLKISKRKVRLERCKTTAAAARAKARTTTAAASTSASSSSRASSSSKFSSSAPRQATRLAAPRDPSLKKASTSAAKAAHQASLAAALAVLPTDERKKLKSLDADRIARRAQKKEQKRLAERYERKQANAAKKAGGGVAGEILGRKPRAMERARKEKKRIRMESKSTLKKKSAR